MAKKRPHWKKKTSQTAQNKAEAAGAALEEADAAGAALEEAEAAGAALEEAEAAGAAVEEAEGAALKEEEASGVAVPASDLAVVCEAVAAMLLLIQTHTTPTAADTLTVTPATTSTATPAATTSTKFTIDVLPKNVDLTLYKQQATQPSLESLWYNQQHSPNKRKQQAAQPMVTADPASSSSSRKGHVATMRFLCFATL